MAIPRDEYLTVVAKLLQEAVEHILHEAPKKLQIKNDEDMRECHLALLISVGSAYTALQKTLKEENA